MTANEIPGYLAAQQAAVFFAIPEPGYLLVSGPDRQAYFQRQTTNDVSRLSSGHSLATVLTNPSARILDVLTLIDTSDQHETTGVITLPDQGEATARYLKSRIFFNDHVKLENHSQEWIQVELCGAQIEAALMRLGLEAPLPAGGTAIFPTPRGEVKLVHMDPALSLGYRLLAPRSAELEMFKQFTQADMVELTPQEYEILRIERGLPQAGAELTTDYTPLETHLNRAISDRKGCYTGQEVIARQITYDKVAQHLCGLRLDRPVFPGARVWVQDRTVGVVTSAVESPRFGPLALAMVRRPHHQPGTRVMVGASYQAALEARITSLPFEEAAVE